MTKPKNPEDKLKVGRKWFDGKDEQIVITKLETAWSIDCSDAQACAFAEISQPSLIRYLEQHPEIALRKAFLKNQLILKAKKVLYEALEVKDKNNKTISTNPELAFKVLERKDKEFIPKQETTVMGELPGAFKDMTKEELLEIARSQK